MKAYETYRCIWACHEGLGEVRRVAILDVDWLIIIIPPQNGQIMRVCDDAEPGLRRVYGYESAEMTLLLRRRAEALRGLKQFDKARNTADESIRIAKKLGLCSYHIDALIIIADILYKQGKFGEELKVVLEARSLLPPTGILSTRARLLDTHSQCLICLDRYQEALMVRKEALALALRIHGPNHPLYAAFCHNTAYLYAKLNQQAEAIDLEKVAVAIYEKTLGASHSSTVNSRCSCGLSKSSHRS